MFLERLNLWSDENPYYIYGGQFYNCLQTNRLPNCTEYCLLRAFESTESAKPFPLFYGKSATGYYVAKEWYDKTCLPKGTELKAGSIAVFSGNDGHVAYIESVIDKTHAVISQSQYDSNKSLRNYKYWERREAELVVGKATLSGIGKLIGFIYLPIKDIRTNRNTFTDQISITEDMVNVRIEPNGDIFQKGCYIPKGIYNALEKRNDGTYDWYKVEENHWVREGNWLTFYPGVEQNTLEKENAKLKEQVANLEAELILANGKLEDIKKILC